MNISVAGEWLMYSKIAGGGPSQVLTSWKDIAAFLGKGVRTVQRWERELQLPVHRPKGEGIVIAFPEELHRWISNRELQRTSESLLQESKARKEELVRLRQQSKRLSNASRQLRAEIERIIQRAKELETQRTRVATSRQPNPG